jgi:hypothetical protein
VYFRVPDVGSGLTDEQRELAFRSVGASFAQQRDDSLAQVLDLLGRREPLGILARLAAYGLYRSWKESERHPTGPERLNQSHVELAQALLLRADPCSQAWEPATPQTVQAVWNELITVTKAFDLASLQELSSADQRVAFLLQQRMRLSTRGVRNWGYYSQVKSITCALLGPLDKDFSALLGFPATLLMHVADYMIRTIERRLSGHDRDVRSLLKATRVEDGFERFRVVFAGTPALDALEAIAIPSTLSLEKFAPLCVNLSELVLPAHFMFSTSTVAEATGAMPEAVKRLFEAISLAEGSLAGQDPRKFFLDNPVWRAPVICVGEGIVFCAIPQTLLSFVLEIVDGWVLPHRHLAARWSDARATGLEKLTRDVLLQALPGARAWDNVGWAAEGDSTSRECDVMIRFDSVLLLVECKSGGVSSPARRGAPARMQRSIEALLEHPSVQSRRLLEALDAHVLGGPRLQLTKPVDLDGVHYVLRLP